MVLRKPELLSSTEVEEHLWELVGPDPPEESRQMSQGGAPKISKFSLEDRRKLTHELLAKAHETNAGPSGHLGGGPIVDKRVSDRTSMRHPSMNCKMWSTTRKKRNLRWQIGWPVQSGGLWKPLEKKQLHY